MSVENYHSQSASLYEVDDVAHKFIELVEEKDNAIFQLVEDTQRLSRENSCLAGTVTALQADLDAKSRQCVAMTEMCEASHEEAARKEAAINELKSHMAEMVYRESTCISILKCVLEGEAPDGLCDLAAEVVSRANALARKNKAFEGIVQAHNVSAGKLLVELERDLRREEEQLALATLDSLYYRSRHLLQRQSLGELIRSREQLDLPPNCTLSEFHRAVERTARLNVALQREREDARSGAVQRDAAHQKLRLSVDHLRLQCDETSNRLQIAQWENSDLWKMITGLSHALHESFSRETQLGVSLSSLAAVNEALKTQLASHQDEVKAVRRTERENTRKVNESLSRTQDETSATIAALRSKVAASSQQSMALKRQLEQRKQAERLAAEENAKLASDLDRRTKELGQAWDALVVAQRDVAGLRAALAAEQKRSAFVEDVMETQNSKVRAAETACLEMRRCVEEDQFALAKWKEAADSHCASVAAQAQSEMENLRRELVTRDAEVSNLSLELAQSRARMETAMQESRTVSHTLHGDLDQADEQRRKLQLENDELLLRIRELELACELSVGQIVQLREEITSLRA